MSCCKNGIYPKRIRIFELFHISVFKLISSESLEEIFLHAISMSYMYTISVGRVWSGSALFDNHNINVYFYIDLHPSCFSVLVLCCSGGCVVYVVFPACTLSLHFTVLRLLIFIVYV